MQIKYILILTIHIVALCYVTNVYKVDLQGIMQNPLKVYNEVKTKEVKFLVLIICFILTNMLLFIMLLSQSLRKSTTNKQKTNQLTTTSKKEDKVQPYISKITIYPLKSTAELDLTRAYVNIAGLEFDRWFMVVDMNGKFVTARTYPILFQVKVTPLQCGLHLQFQGKKDIVIDVHKLENNEKKPVNIWIDTTKPVTVCDDEVNEWFSDIIKKEKVQVVYMNDRFSRVNGHIKCNVSFADRCPVHLASTASLDDLNKRCPLQVNMNRFRPNLVVEGCTPFEEDTWKTIKIGDVIYENLQQKLRCVLVLTDPTTGETHKTEPLKTLMEYRQAVSDGRSYLGINLAPKNEGIIQLNDKIEVLEYTTPLELKQFQENKK